MAIAIVKQSVIAADLFAQQLREALPHPENGASNPVTINNELDANDPADKVWIKRLADVDAQIADVDAEMLACDESDEQTIEALKARLLALTNSRTRYQDIMFGYNKVGVKVSYLKGSTCDKVDRAVKRMNADAAWIGEDRVYARYNPSERTIDVVRTSAKRRERNLRPSAEAVALQLDAMFKASVKETEAESDTASE